MSFAIGLLLLLFAGLLGWLVWFSVQSLRQAKMLGSYRNAFADGEPAAVYGEVKVVRPARNIGRGQCLWHRQIAEECGGYGRSRYWRTVSDETEMATFFIVVNGREIHVSDLPTEVQGSERDTQRDYGDGIAGLTGGWFGENPTRQTDKWLPASTHVSVVGRLTRSGNEWSITKDPTLGLLLSTRDPERAAKTETLKGWLGLVGAAALLATGIWIWNSLRHAL